MHEVLRLGPLCITTCNWSWKECKKFIKSLRYGELLVIVGEVKSIGVDVVVTWFLHFWRVGRQKCS